MNQVLAYELINKAYMPQQPDNQTIMPPQQVPPKLILVNLVSATISCNGGAS